MRQEQREDSLQVAIGVDPTKRENRLNRFQSRQPGRGVTAQIIALSAPDHFRAKDSRDKLLKACSSFIRMYRPHEAREDTILFPALRTILSPKQVADLGDSMEEDEKKVLGDEGFEKSVDQVATIEKQLGIYALPQFTPKP